MIKLPTKLSNYLDKSKYKYEIISHRKTYTAWDTAQTEKIDPKEVAKAVVLKIDNKDYAVALLPANRNVDTNKLLKIINVQRKKQLLKTCRKVSFATESWMKKNIFGKVGAVAPFSGILKFPIYMDKTLAKNKKIYTGTGEYDLSLRINTNQYIKTEKPILGSFSIKK